jgi:hypothetical protein
LLQIKALQLLNSIMDFVRRMAKVFRLIFKEGHIISNSLQIKDLPLLKSLMDFVRSIANFKRCAECVWCSALA